MNQDERSEQVLPAENLAALTVADHRWDVFAQLRNCKELTTKQGRPYLIVELADVHATIEARTLAGSGRRGQLGEWLHSMSSTGGRAPGARGAWAMNQRACSSAGRQW